MSTISYASLCQNCKTAVRAWKLSKRVLNDLLRRNKQTEAEDQTKVLALLYCSMAESFFYKILYTPNALSLSEIENVKDITNRNGIVEGWKKCISYGLDKVNASLIPGYDRSIIEQRLIELCEKYIYDPSLIRNKIAHGQWKEAFNRKLTGNQTQITQKLQTLSTTFLEANQFALTAIAQMVTDLLASPDKAHPRDFIDLSNKIDNEASRRAIWTTTSKKQKLQLKKRETVKVV